MYLFEGRWEESLAAIQQAWSASPNRPFVASALVRALLRLNRANEAVEVMRPAAEGQSYESLMLLAWSLCTVAERSERPERLRLAGQAWQHCSRLEKLAPLCDRVTKQEIAACRFDIALLREDSDAMRQQAEKLRFPVFRQVSRNLQANPDGERVLLHCRPVFQKPDRCLPTSMACIAGTFGRQIDADALAEELTYNGTPAWRALAWLRNNGYAAKAFLLTGERARSLLRKGVPFVYTFDTGIDNAHATAAVGIDESAGMLIYHDPGSERFGRALLDRLGEDESPLGPYCFAFVPAEKATLLDCIAQADADLAELCQNFRQAYVLKNMAGMASVIEQMQGSHPDSPVTEAYRAHWQLLSGQLAEGIATLERMLGEYPLCHDLQRMLLEGLNRTRNTARVREFLGQIVRRGRVPGHSDANPWTYPPSSYVSQLADLEAQTADGIDDGLELLTRLVEREPGHSMAYYVLGVIRARQDRLDLAALPMRLASMLDQTNEGFARATFDVLRLLGKTDEGLFRLGQRVEQLGHMVEGGPPWATLITALQDCGEIDLATSTARQALEARPDDPKLLSFLVRFWIGVGRWETAQALLEKLEASASQIDYCQAAVHYFRFMGQWRRALELCRRWAELERDKAEPHRMLTLLLRNEQSVLELVEVTDAWCKDRPDDEEFEFIHYEQLQGAALSRSPGAVRSGAAEPQSAGRLGLAGVGASADRKGPARLRRSARADRCGNA